MLIQFQNISKVWTVKFVFQCHITIVLTVAVEAWRKQKFNFKFCRPFFFTTNQIVFQNDIVASAVPGAFAMVWAQPDCMANLALLAKRLASGIMYMLQQSPFRVLKKIV